MAAIVALSVSGCAVADFFFGCENCALEADDAELHETDQDALLAFGLTVDARLHHADGLRGGIGWLAETDEGLDLREVDFPDDLQPGDHRLIVWRVPAGTWSLRHARLGQDRHSRVSAVISERTLAVPVKAGHVTIIGELHVDGHHKEPILTYDPDPRFVRQELKQYSNIQSPLDEQTLSDIRKHPTSKIRVGTH